MGLRLGANSISKNPTYEDMLLLSSLLGPAKPPVATREDVASASGIFRVQVNGDTLIAVAIQGVRLIQIGPNERCLVCLENYQEAEELRQLTYCSHMFHRECIDQVSHCIPSRSTSFEIDSFFSGSLQVAIPARFAEARVLMRKKETAWKAASLLRPVDLN